MADDDLQDVLQNAENSRPKKFQGWFDQNFDCNKDKGKMVCEIEGERMKIPNSVRQDKFSEDRRSAMVEAVKDNHEINKESGITYGDNTGGNSV